jgi:hypothetical protein
VAESGPITGRQAALSALLVGAVDGVVQAQARLDRDALSRLTDYIDTPQGGLALPPLWYTVSDVRIDLEAAASVTRLEARRGGAVRLDARLVNPASVSLFGYQASSGLKVTLRLAPREAAGAVPPLPNADAPPA